MNYLLVSFIDYNNKDNILSIDRQYIQKKNYSNNIQKFPINFLNESPNKQYIKKSKEIIPTYLINPQLKKLNINNHHINFFQNSSSELNFLLWQNRFPFMVNQNYSNLVIFPSFNNFTFPKEFTTNFSTNFLNDVYKTADSIYFDNTYSDQIINIYDNKPNNKIDYNHKMNYVDNIYSDQIINIYNNKLINKIHYNYKKNYFDNTYSDQIISIYNNKPTNKIHYNHKMNFKLENLDKKNYDFIYFIDVNLDEFN